MPVSKSAQAIGRRVRETREAKGLSSAAVAEQAGVPQADVDAIERGDETPSVGQLLRMARAMEVSPAHFFEPQTSTQRVEVVRAGERWHVERSTNEEGTSLLSYSYEALSYRLTDKMMQPFYVEVRIGQEAQVEPSQHEGEEFMYVLDGELELELDGSKLTLGPGDSVYFDSRIPHVLRAAGPKPPRLIVVVGTAWAAASQSALTRAF